MVEYVILCKSLPGTAMLWRAVDSEAVRGPLFWGSDALLMLVKLLYEGLFLPRFCSLTGEETNSLQPAGAERLAFS